MSVLPGVVLLGALLGGTLTVYGIRFLAWSDARRARGAERATP